MLPASLPIAGLYATLRAGVQSYGARAAVLDLPATRPPWTGTGITLRRGQAYTLLAGGRVYWSSRHPELYGGPGFHLWARIHPGGRLVNVAHTSGSFVADVDGELELGLYFGLWRDAYGTLATPTSAYARLSGGLAVLCLAWPDGDAARGLAMLAADYAHPLLEQECARVNRADPTPAGWDYLLETGSSDIWHSCDIAGQRRICLAAHDAQGIIRTPVDFPLQPDTELSWRWQVDEHPSRAAEDRAQTHDYVSLALEFADGRDLTWMWSAALAPDSCFPCPVQAWSARETHYVVRSGRASFGSWQAECRSVTADLERARIQAPGDIVAVWLIAVASFQHGTARAAFADIRLRTRTRELQVL